MALVVKDRIKETSSTTGTGTLTLGGAIAGFRTFADVGDGNTTYYCIKDGNNFEVGIGTYTHSGTTLSRDTVLQTSAGNTTKINCTGSQEVFVTQPADKAVFEDASGDTTFSGVVTANSGISIDNITIDGTEIDLSSGDLTIDVAGAIELDSDTGVIDFDDDTLNFGRIENSSSNFKIEARVQDKDIILAGNDGGSGVNALTLDMSAAGAATFNAGITAPSLVIDNITYDGSTITSDTHLNLDIVGDLRIDVDGAEVKLSDGGTQFGVLYQSSNNFYLQSSVSNKDMKFEVNDAGSITTALTLSGANAGAATFNSSVQSGRYNMGGTTFFIDNVSGDYGSIRVEGNSNSWAGYAINDDWVFMSNGADRSGLYNDTDNEWAIQMYRNAQVDLYHNGGTKLSTTSSGISVADNITASGTVEATRYYIDGTSRYIDSASGNYGTIRVEGGAGNYEGYALRDDFVFMSGSTANCGIYNDIDNEWMILCYRNDQVQLRHNGTETFRTDVQGIHVRSSSTASDGAIFLGTNAHAHIYNDENTAIYMRNGANENIIYGAENSHTYIYHDATWKLRTNTNGIQVRDSNTSDGRIAFGSNEHAKIYNDEGTAISITTGANEYFIYANENSYTYLYYNGTWKARARSDGFEVSGSLVVSDKISVNNSYGVSGQVLTSRGSGSTAQWQDAGGGAWEVIGNYSGNATGTNATVDFVHGSGGFVHDATTYKHMKMYAQLWQNNGATGSSYLNVFPLVGTTSSYAPMSNLIARHSAFQLIHPEFTGVTYNHTKWGYGAQSFSNNQGAVATNIRLHRSSTTATSVGMGMFSETINGTSYSSGDRFYPTAVEMDFPCKGIDPMFGFMGHIYYRFDTGLFDNYTYYNRWMMMGDGYGKVGWRITSTTSNVPFNYDITWIGLKP